MMRMMMNDDHCYCRYWWSFLFTCDWPAASESVLEAGSVPDVSPQHVWATKSQRGAWEDEGRLERPGWAAEPPTDHTTVDRQDTILKITASLQWIQIISDRLNTANVLMPKLACTQVKLVCSLEISDSPHRGFSRGRIWTQPWPEDSRHSTVTYVQKSLWEVFCQIKSLLEFSSVLLWQQLVLEELHDRVNNTHMLL